VFDPEAKSVPNPEYFLEDALAWRPQLPAAALEIASQTTNTDTTEATEPGYAWERLPSCCVAVLWLAYPADAWQSLY